MSGIYTTPSSLLPLSRYKCCVCVCGRVWGSFQTVNAKHFSYLHRAKCLFFFKCPCMKTIIHHFLSPIPKRNIQATPLLSSPTTPYFNIRRTLENPQQTTLTPSHPFPFPTFLTFCMYELWLSMVSHFATLNKCFLLRGSWQ